MVKKQTGLQKKHFSLPELQHAVSVLLQNTNDEELKGMRCPSMPTLKNMSRKGMFSGVPLPAASNQVLNHLKANIRFYKPSAAIEPAPAKQNQSEFDQERSLSASPQVNEATLATMATMIAEMLAEVRQLSKRVALAERSITTVTTAVAGEVHPAVLLAIGQLTDTRKYVMTQFDAQRQTVRQAESSRGFESASAMDAQRILAGISRLNDTVNRLIQ